MRHGVTASQPKHYPLELKESVARRYLSTSASYRELAEETGANLWTVRSWVKAYREHGTLGKRSKSRRPTDERAPSEKLRLLFEAKSLSDAERGEFLRREGIRDGDLERWEQEAIGGLQGGRSSSKDELRIRELERERDHQQKRLKEAKALLELQKKVQALWADEDNDTSES
jgi:transposase